MENYSSSCIIKTTRTHDSSAGLLKRKQACKLATLLNAAKKRPRILKRIRTEDRNRLRRSEGSVVYDSFAPDIYEWLTTSSVVNAGNDLRNSGIPSRFMFYDKAGWKHFPTDATTVLCEQFRAAKNSAELFIHGRTYLVSFVQMMQLNIGTGYLRAVAWTDEHGKSSFPPQFFEGYATQLSVLLQETLDHQRGVKSENQVTTSQICRPVDWTKACNIGALNGPDGCGGHPTWLGMDGFARQRLIGDFTGAKMIDVGLETSSSHRKVGGEASADMDDNFTLLGDKLIKLEHGDEEYHMVKNKFLAGLGMLSTYTSVVGIYRDTHSSTSGHARLHAFQTQQDITKKIRGDANLQYAWHGTSKRGVSGIVLHGFGQRKTPKNGTAYGVGIYLAPEHYSQVSAVYSDVDENGEQHMVLCRMIMGNMEQVPLGSEQFHPSGEAYDTGLDDHLNPKRYIVWSTHMNTHILPQYVVSFKISPQWHDSMVALRGKLASDLSLPVWTSTQAGSEECMHQKVEKSIYSCPCKVDITLNQGGTQQESTNRAPRSPWLSFPKLLYMLRLKLRPADMVRLRQHYVEFKAGNMPREHLIRNIRAVTGDHILADSIRSMQPQEIDKSSTWCQVPGLQSA